MSKRNGFLAATLCGLLMATSSVFAGADPATLVPYTPPPPPPPPAAVQAPVLSPAQVQVTASTIRTAQSVVTAVGSTPGATIPVALQTRVVNVLSQVLPQPDVLAQLGLTADEVQALIEDVRALPTR